MRICMVLEGCYPYVRGGVSSWMHGYIQAMPQHEFVLWVIGAKAEDKGKFKYEILPNVAEIREIFLDDALRLTATGKEKLDFSQEEINSLSQLVSCENPDWDVLFNAYNERKVGPISFLMSEDFLNVLLDMCRERYPFIAFAELFHTVRSMLLPMLYLLGQDVPKADVYHSTSTGYGGLLGSLGSWKYNRPYILTEHGIYTREREEEILRAKWVSSYFKQHWINMFFMVAKCSYNRAANVTALFQRYSDVQVDLGCSEDKRKVISNGIKIANFKDIPLKEPNGYIDICAIVRIHPIKDIKTMILSFFDAKSRVKNIRLHILGDTDDKQYGEECKALIQQLNVQDCFLVGNTNVPVFLRDMDFTILTSISEGQPLAVLESFAAARPCITTDVGCCRELIEGAEGDDFGPAGICEAPMYAQGIANAIELLATNEDLRLEMGQAGRNRTFAYYRHEDMIKNYLDNYEEVLSHWQA